MTNEIFGGHMCPMKIYKTAIQMTNDPIIEDLKKGELWNGRFYGYGENGKYIYVNNEKKYIFPKESLSSLDKEGERTGKRIYAKLHDIKKKSEIIGDEIGNCEACKYFGGYVNEDFEDYSLVCSFRKKNKLR